MVLSRAEEGRVARSEFRTRSCLEPNGNVPICGTGLARRPTRDDPSKCLCSLLGFARAPLGVRWTGMQGSQQMTRSYSFDEHRGQVAGFTSVYRPANHAAAPDCDPRPDLGVEREDQALTPNHRQGHHPSRHARRHIRDHRRPHRPLQPPPPHRDRLHHPRDKLLGHENASPPLRPCRLYTPIFRRLKVPTRHRPRSHAARLIGRAGCRLRWRSGAARCAGRSSPARGRPAPARSRHPMLRV